MPNRIIQDELFCCSHLGSSENDESDIRSFSVRDSRGTGLLQYIQHAAFADEDSGLMRTYVIRDNISSEMVGYFSLKAGLISVNERTEEIQDLTSGITLNETLFDTLPGVELANFAVNWTYLQHHPNLKGVGKVIFNKFILPIVKQTSENIGIKALYIFALPYDNLIARYKEYGFSRLAEPYEKELHRRLKPHYDRSCIFMFRVI